MKKRMKFAIDGKEVSLGVASTNEIPIYTQVFDYPFDPIEEAIDLVRVYFFESNTHGVRCYQEDDRTAYDDAGNPMYNVQLKTI